MHYSSDLQFPGRTLNKHEVLQPIINTIVYYVVLCSLWANLLPPHGPSSWGLQFEKKRYKTKPRLFEDDVKYISVLVVLRN